MDGEKEHKIKILLVEDDEFLTEIYVTKFQAKNFEVENVKEGNLAIDKIKSFLPNIILLDIVLPQMSGFEILKQIKENPAIANIPVIILSNLGGVEDHKEGIDKGASDYLVKSQVTPTELVEKIENLLAKRS